MDNEMMVADLGPGVTVIVSYPGQTTPNPKELRSLFGIRNPGQVIPLSQSQARPATDDEKLAARVAAQQGSAGTDELAALKARVAELEAVQGTSAKAK